MPRINTVRRGNAFSLCVCLSVKLNFETPHLESFGVQVVYIFGIARSSYSTEDIGPRSRSRSQEPKSVPVLFCVPFSRVVCLPVKGNLVDQWILILSPDMKIISVCIISTDKDDCITCYCLTTDNDDESNLTTAHA